MKTRTENRSENETTRPRGYAWLLFALTVTALVYWRSLRGELVYDDKLLIGRNPTIASLANIPSLFLQPYWGFLQNDASEQIGYWRPLTAMVQTLAWWAGSGTPWAFHVVSVAFHLLATAGTFFLARRLTGQGTTAGFIALLFGLHPIHVESVAWISALNDPLFATFGFASLTLFLRWRAGGSRGIPLLAVAALLLALLAKEMALAFLLMVPVVDSVWQWRRSRASDESFLDGFLASFKDWPRAYGPFLAVLAIYIGARMVVFGSVAAGLDRAPTTFGVDKLREALLRLEILGGALQLLAWPADLVAFRPFRPTLPLSDPSVLLAGGATLATLLLGGLLAARKRHLELAALLLIPIGLAPALISVSSLGIFPLSDRFLYIASFGFVLLLTVLLKRYLPERLALVVLLVVAALYGAKSWRRIEIWESGENLFRNAVAESPRSAYLRWGLGRVLLESYSKKKESHILAEAKQAFIQSQDLLLEARKPGSDLFVTSTDHLQANLGYGLCHVFEDIDGDYGSVATAISIFETLAAEVGKLHYERQEAELRGQRVVGPHLSLELVYTALGSAHLEAGHLEEAEEAFRKALVINPKHLDAHKGMADVAMRMDNAKAAVRHLEKALTFAPGDYDTRLSLAQSLREAGMPQRARRLAEELIAADPDHAQPFWILGTVLLDEGKPREALVYLRRAQRVDEFDGHTWFLIATAMGTLEVNPEATIEAFTKAATLDPKNFVAHNNLARLLLGQGKVELAGTYFVRSYALTENPQYLADLRRILAQLPLESPELAFELALADAARKELDLTEYWLDRALEIDPDHPESLFEKAKFLRQRERHDEALAAMRRACELVPGDIPRHLEFGKYLSDQGLLDEAEEILVRCKSFTGPEDWSEAMLESSRTIMDKLLAEVRAAGAPSASNH